jgi:hypothetical protein
MKIVYQVLKFAILFILENVFLLVSSFRRLLIFIVLGIYCPILKKILVRMRTGGETTFCSAEGASLSRESLRQKNSCLTQLWRELRILGATKGESRLW